MAADPPDKSDHKTFPTTRHDNPTVRAFQAVQLPTQTPEERDASVDTERDAPALNISPGELSLAVMMLAEQVEALGGDVGEIRALLRLGPKAKR